MRLKISKSKNAASLYVIKSVTINGKRTSKIVEKLGTFEHLKAKLNGRDPIDWANEYIAELTRLDKEGSREVILKYSPAKLIDKDQQSAFNGGYLFLQQLYHHLGLQYICKDISKKYKFSFDLNSILSTLLYSRIIFPSSKLATYELSRKFIEQPDFELQHIYRALEVLAKENDFIQAAIYENSVKLSKRNTSVLYYDCTNYFFETEQEDGLKQYGPSKEHRPNPIVQMGLFMDGDGIPLAFHLQKGNTNEQVTLKPLEKKILRDFHLSKFIVCTDAGLSSQENREFNNFGGRAFITTQSIKKLKGHLMEWALSTTGWKLPDDKKIYDISTLGSEDKEKIFYKERWIKEKGLEQKLIVSYSLKYQSYQRSIRQSQIERAEKVIAKNPGKLEKHRQNDYKRLIKKEEDGSKKVYSINRDLIFAEERFDGFYAICTNLESEAGEIIKINKRRWELEECFRIMKSEFKARPVYLSRDDRIEAHFMTCFLSLILYRYMEKKVGERYTCPEIIRGLREMNFYKVKGEGYIPTYTRNDFTDDIHEAFGFRTDYQIVTTNQMKNILKSTKS